MKTFIRENTWYDRGSIDFGWGNGYVLIPQGHNLHGKHYNDIKVNIHFGLTFSALVDDDMIEDWNLDKEDKGMWCVGFDTMHFGDTLDKWPKEEVEKETERLKDQLLSYK